MIVTDISNGSTTVVLHAGDCAVLAQVCKAAEETKLPGHTPDQAHAIITTMESFFLAAGIAGFAQEEMHAQDLEILDKTLQANGLVA